MTYMSNYSLSNEVIDVQEYKTVQSANWSNRNAK